MLLLQILLVFTNFSFAFNKNYVAVGPSVAHFAYEEPGVMTEKGFIYGVELDARQELSADLSFVGWLRYLQGDVEYTGAYFDGTPLVKSNLHTILEGQGGIAVDLAPLEFHAGFGYRQWIDHESSSEPGDYDRTTTYYYLPLRLAMNLSNGFRLSFEYSYFLKGHNKSTLSDVSPTYPDFEFDQKNGSGYKLRAGYDMSPIAVDVFYEAWDIDDSELAAAPTTISPSGYLVEPKNNTKLFGANMYWVF